MPAIANGHGHVALPFGRFYGREEFRRSAPGVELSLLRVDPHRIVQRHTHDEAHFVLVLDGLYVSTAHGAPPVSAGTQLIFNPAGTTHRDRFEARDRVVDGRFLTISVAADVVAECARDGSMPRRAVVLDDAAAVSVATRLARACALHAGDASLTQHALALELLSHTLSHTRSHTLSHAQVTRDASRRHRRRDHAPAWLQHARERLDDALGGAVSIADVAQAADVHPVHLSRVFRQYLGVGPADYLRARRLEHARSLLQCTTRSLSDIALTCGFSHQSHFSNVFRRAHGETPSAFRKRLSCAGASSHDPIDSHGA